MELELLPAWGSSDCTYSGDEGRREVSLQQQQGTTVIAKLVLVRRSCFDMIVTINMINVEIANTFIAAK